MCLFSSKCFLPNSSWFHPFLSSMLWKKQVQILTSQTGKLLMKRFPSAAFLPPRSSREPKLGTGWRDHQENTDIPLEIKFLAPLCCLRFDNCPPPDSKMLVVLVWNRVTFRITLHIFQCFANCHQRNINIQAFHNHLCDWEDWAVCDCKWWHPEWQWKPFHILLTMMRTSTKIKISEQMRTSQTGQW